MRFVTLLFLSLSLLLGQGTTSRVVGTVQDPTGSPIAGAKVKLTNESTGLNFETQTSQAGTYQFESLQIGLYALVNLAVATGIAPTTGLPLPFVSYGGSALLANMAAAGILYRISAMNQTEAALAAQRWSRETA